MSTKEERVELLQGTLDLLMLKTLLLGPLHGHALAKTIERSSNDVLQVEQGSLYPALHRMIKREGNKLEEGVSENNRGAHLYGTRSPEPSPASSGRRSNGMKHELDHLDTAIRDHIERENADNVAPGMTPKDARSAALRKFDRAQDGGFDGSPFGASSAKQLIVCATSSIIAERSRANENS